MGNCTVFMRDGIVKVIDLQTSKPVLRACTVASAWPSRMTGGEPGPKKVRSSRVLSPKNGVTGRARVCEVWAARQGLSAAQLRRGAKLIHQGQRVSFWWTMGVNQGHEATRTAQAIINLALMTGNIGRPGTGANSITGQCNAMGSRLFANVTNLIGGHDAKNEADRAKIAGVLGIDKALIPRQPSLAYDQ